MTVATEKRTAASQVLKDWAARQAAADKEPSQYLATQNNTEVALYQGGDFRFNGRRIYITENGHLIIWHPYRLSRTEYGFVFDRYYEWTETWWAVHHEDTFNDDAAYYGYPDLYSVDIGTHNLVIIAAYLASL